MDELFEYALRTLAYALRITIRWSRVIGSGQWHLANATVTAPPRRSEGIFGATVEIVYTYRVDGELYTGLHEEPCLLTESLPEYIERFSEGRLIVVRVKPGNPDVSLVRDSD